MVHIELVVSANVCIRCTVNHDHTSDLLHSSITHLNLWQFWTTVIHISLSLSHTHTHTFSLSLPSGQSLVLAADLAPLVVTAVPLPQRAKLTPAARVTVHHQNEDVNAPIPGLIPVPDRDPIPVPDAIRGIRDRGAVLTRLMQEGGVGVGGTIGAGIAADHQCPPGGGTRETE